MIFVTVGTEKFPFDRLIRALDEAKRSGRIQQKVFAQIGTSTYLPQACDYSRFLSFSSMIEYIRTADIIIGHAGVGTMLLSRQSKKIPIVFARQAAFGEHVDDHQIQFARKMEQKGLVIAAYHEQELLDKINNYQHIIQALKQQQPLPSRDAALIDYLRKIISETGIVL
jgi:UDP-N-acetylglucosamine transferase subunit ALG13